MTSSPQGTQANHRGHPAPGLLSPTYGQGQREVGYSSAVWAEAAARDFQHRGFRRRTRGLGPGDVLVGETEEGFSVFWIPRDVAVAPSPAPGGGSPSPGWGECVWERGPGGEGPGEAGSSLPLPSAPLPFLPSLFLPPRPLAGESPAVRPRP